MDIVKVIIFVLLLLILLALGSGLYYLMKDRGQSNRTVKALAWRVILSFVLFLILLLGFATGIINPHG